MKLKDLSPRGGTASGKRRKRQLLIEPPALEPATSQAGDDASCHLGASESTGSCSRLSERSSSHNCPEGAHCRRTGEQACTSTMRASRENDAESRKPASGMRAPHNHKDHHQHHHQYALNSSATTTTTTSVITQQPRRAPLDALGSEWNSGSACARRASRRDNDGSGRSLKAQSAHSSSSSGGGAPHPKRKSELTSFLTILFGSLLAALVLAHHHHLPVLCGQLQAAQQNVTTTLSPRLTNDSGATAGALNLALTTSSVSGSAASSGLNSTRGVESASEAADADELPPAAAAAESEDDEQDEPAAHEGAAAGNPHKTRLGELLADSAGAGVGALLSHLQPAAAVAESTAAAAAEELPAGESEEDVEAGSDPADTPTSAQPDTPTGSPLPANETTTATTNTTTTTTVPDEFPPTISTMDESTRAAMGVYAKWRLAADDLIELFSRKLMPVVLEHGYDVDAGTVSGLLQVFNGIRQLRPWAVKLLDASFKLAPGVLVGTQSDFGDFDECLNIRVDDPSGLGAAEAASAALGEASSDDPDFPPPPPPQLDPLTGLRSSTLVGRYCLADVEFPKPSRQRRRSARTGGYTPNTTLNQLDLFEPIELRKTLLDFQQFPAYKDTIFVETGNFFHMLYVDPIRVGVCMTNKIDPDALAAVVNKLLDEFKITINFRGRCVTKYDRPVWTRQQRVSAYVLLVACTLVLVSTLLDLLHTKLHKLPCPRAFHQARLRLQATAARHRPLFTSFSLVRNTRRLFRASGAPQPPPVAAGASLLATQHKPPRISNNLGYAPSLAATSRATATSSSSTTTSASSLADESSVESSPAIERRASHNSGATANNNNNNTTDLLASSSASSMHDLIGHHQSHSQQGEFNFTQHFADHHHHHLEQSKEDQREALQGGKRGGANLASLHGIRVLTMTWMIVNHTYMFGGFFVLWAHRRLIDIAEWPKSLSFQMVLNGWLTVETYFFLSALIIVLTVMPLMRARKFNYFAYILHRLLRLLPAYVGLVCLNFLWPLLSAGPVWLVKGKSFVQTPCEENLWTNFLFINNWIWPEKQCMVHTWFLSADFQLYLLAPVIVYLLYRRPALGHTLNLLVAVGASVLSGFVIYAYELLPATLINKLEFDAIKQQLSYSYFATYQHMGPYCLGLLTGYLLHKRPHARLPKHLTWLLWLLLPPLSFTTLLLTYLWNGAYDDPTMINPSPLVSAFYVAIHRTIWTSLVAWLVFACTTGRAKMLASFLSHSIFLPISRLSYSIYLVHLPVIMFRSLNLRHTLEWTDQNILWEACGNFVVSIFMGFFLNVAFESPIINLENVLMRGGGACNRRRACNNASATAAQCHAADQKHQKLFHAGKLDLSLVGPTGKPIINADSSNRGQQDQQKPDTQGFSYLTGTGSSSSASNSDTASEDHQCAAANEEPCDVREDQVARVNPRSSSLARGQKLISHQDLDVARVRKSLRPKQTPSVEQIFGNTQSHQHAGAQQQEIDLLRGNEATASSLTSSSGESREGEDEIQQKQQQQHRLRASQQERFFAERSLRRQSTAASHRDTVYSLTDEYRHYAPAGYQQWRRVMNNQQLLQHGARLMSHSAVAPLTSSRPQQYATLARSSRLHRDPTMMGAADLHYQNSHQLARYNQRLLAQHQREAYHDQRLMPNSSSELGYDSSQLLDNGRQVPETFEEQAQHQAQHMARRRQGRYNTLTGTGSRDWRTQTTSAGTRTSDFLSSWDASSAWLASSSAQNAAGGSLLIPRVDSSTLRRVHQQRASGSLVGLPQEQQEYLGDTPGKILEEPAEVEQAENSAL